MIRDRDYMRSASGGSGPSLTITLIVVLIALFLLQSCLMFYGRLPLDEWFGLSLDGIKHGRVWQLLTFQFMHSTPWPWHVLGNCLGLFFLGRSIEETLGKKKFLALYFGSGIFGGVLSLLTTWILPNHPADVAVLGASAGVMGLLAVYATLFPMRELTIFVLFFPVTLRVQYLFWFIFAISAFGTLIPFDDIAHPAHLGGILFGLFFIRQGTDLAANLSNLNPFRRKHPAEMTGSARLGSFSPRKPKAAEAEDLPPQEFISQEVDPILDKISAHGIQSLTERERQILQAARNRMSKR